MCIYTIVLWKHLRLVVSPSINISRSSIYICILQLDLLDLLPPILKDLQFFVKQWRRPILRQWRIGDIGLFLDLRCVPLLNLQLRLVYRLLLPKCWEGTPLIVVRYQVPVQMCYTLEVNGLLRSIRAAIRDYLNIRVFNGAKFPTNWPWRHFWWEVILIYARCTLIFVYLSRALQAWCSYSALHCVNIQRVLLAGPHLIISDPIASSWVPFAALSHQALAALLSSHHPAYSSSDGACSICRGIMGHRLIHFIILCILILLSDRFFMPGDGSSQLGVSSWEDYVREFLLLLAPIIWVCRAETRQVLFLGDE